MPLKCPDYQKTYTARFDANGLPIAEFECWGGISYMLVCPCCGMLHELKRDVLPGQVVKPNCLIRVTHPTVFKAWQKLHPEAKAHTEFMLQLRGVALEPTETIISKPREPARRRAA